MLSNLFAPLEKNSGGDLNYKAFLVNLLGKAEADRAFDSTNSEQINTTTAPKVAGDPAMATLGRLVGPKLAAIEDSFKLQSSQKIGSAPALKEEQISKILNDHKIVLDVDSRMALQTFCNNNKDSYGFVSSAKLMTAMGLTQSANTLQKKQAPTKVLTEQQMRASQDMIIEIRRDLTSKNMQPT